MATAYPELTISIDRREVGSYRLELSFWQPGSESGVDPAAGVELSAAIDLTALELLKEQPQEYGKKLSQMLFSEEKTRTAFAQAQAVALVQKEPLRLRLQIGPRAADLHALRWEMLYDADGKAPLLNTEVLFSRYLSSSSWKAVNLRPQHNLRALVAVSDPSDLDFYSLEQVKVEDEVARARQALNGIDVEVIGGEAGPVTLNNLAQRLLQGRFDILYLVAHGKTRDTESVLLLQNEQGETARVSGAALAEEIKKLDQQPLLAILLACESARQEAGAVLTAAGPLLAAAGIPAVLAMQDKISMETAALFMPVFLQELVHDGVVDRAAAVARNAVRGRPDFWMPVLYARLKTGMIYGEAAVEERVTRQVRRLNRNLIWIAGIVVLLLLGLGGFLIWQAGQTKEVVLQATPTPSRMTQDFNVAIAEFGVEDRQGNPVDGLVGRDLAGYMVKRLEESFREMPLSLRPEIWPDTLTGKIQGKTPEERRKAAEKRATEINAHVLVYGQIAEGEGEGSFSPEFVVNYQGFANNAPEVLGGNIFGKPLTVDIPFDSVAAQTGGNQALLARSRALGYIAIGLAYYAFDNYAEAKKNFTAAINIPEWLEEDGQELAYLLRGNAISRQVSIDKDYSQLPEALQDYNQAWSISAGEYGRALIGKGGVVYLQALRNPLDPHPGNIDAEGLAAAEKIFTDALNLPGQPESYNLPSKAYFSLGQIYQVRIQSPEDRANIDKALESYKKVTDAYECVGEASQDCVAKSTQELASFAYARLGLLYAGLGNYEQALAEYQKSFDISSPYYKAVDTFSRGIIQLQQALEANTPENAAQAVELFNTAQATLEQGVQRARSLSRQDTIDEFTPYLAYTYIEQGKLAIDQNELQTARQKFQAAEELLSKSLARARFKVEQESTTAFERETKQAYLDSWQPLLDSLLVDYAQYLTP